MRVMLAAATGMFGRTRTESALAGGQGSYHRTLSQPAPLRVVPLLGANFSKRSHLQISCCRSIETSSD